MTLQLLHSEFPCIWGKFLISFFISVRSSWEGRYTPPYFSSTPLCTLWCCHSIHRSSLKVGERKYLCENVNIYANFLQICFETCTTVLIFFHLIYSPGMFQGKFDQFVVFYIARRFVDKRDKSVFVQQWHPPQILGKQSDNVRVM